MQSAICLLAKRAQRVTGELEADCVLLIEQCASSVVHNVAFKFKKDARGWPEGIANVLVDFREQALVVGVVACC